MAGSAGLWGVQRGEFTLGVQTEERTMKSTLKMAMATALLGSAIGLASPALADFPEKPVEMTILFGGSAQTVGQILADGMSKALGSPVVAVSRPGGGGAIGYSHVNGTDADGYSIVWNSNSISTVHYQGNIPFDYKAFAPIARIGSEVPVLAVSTKSGWTDLKSMAEAAKAKGQPLKVGVSGLGSFTHLAAAALFDKLGVKVVYIPYGEGRAPAELLAGRVDAAIQWPGQFIPHVQNNTIAMLCSTGMEKIAIEIDVPTCHEAGATDLNVTMWRGLAAPAGTPDDVIAKLQDAAKATVEDEAFANAARNLGFEPGFLPAAEFGELIASDDAVISELMTTLGLKNK